jgi:hypothetical protein
MSLEELRARFGRQDGELDVDSAVEVHREAVAAAAATALRVIDDLGLADKAEGEVDPLDVVAAVGERTDNAAVGQVISLSADAGRELRENLSVLSGTQVEALNDVSGRITGAHDPTELADVLAGLQAAPPAELPGIGEGARVAQAIVEDGLETIYNTTASPVVEAASRAAERAGLPGPAQVPAKRNPAVGVMLEDAAGAAGGAVAGSVGLAPGAAVGALGGAVSTSVYSVVKHVWRWLRWADD